MTQVQPLVPPERDGRHDGVVDLREPTSIARVAEPSAVKAQPETAEPASGGNRSRSRRRWTIVAVAVGLVAAFFLAQGIGQVTHDARQRHLAYQFGQPVRRPLPGQATMNLQIPAIGVNEIVIEGASASDLRSGPGHVVGTADIGGKGNDVILGRRTRYSGPFSKLGELKKGDQIAMQSRQSQVRLYRVKSVTVVPNSSTAPIEPTKQERLTLVTSTAGWFPAHRVVVVAEPTATSPILGKPASGGRVSSGALDQRPASTSVGFLLWAGLALLVVILVFAARDLLRRYPASVVMVALVPVALLLYLVFLFSLDIVLASTV
jgi:sortase A